ncbi:MAG: hypothetical protein KF846_12530 [Cyclobacteriaceae bacterium]|nr:hypothetical protein [Cyclobacteriaceae bacterium]
MRKKLPLLLILAGLLTVIAGVFMIFDNDQNTVSLAQSNLTSKTLNVQPPAKPGNELLIGALMITGLGLTTFGYYALRKQKQASAKNSITFDFSKTDHHKLREVVGICLIIGSTFLS